MARLNTWRSVATALILSAIATMAAVSIAPTAANATQAGTTIVRPAPGLTMGAIAQMAGIPTSGQGPTHALVISAQRSDLSAEEAVRLATGQNAPGVTLVRSVHDIAPSTTVESLTNGEPATLAMYLVRECVRYPASTYCCILTIVWVPA